MVPVIRHSSLSLSTRFFMTGVREQTMSIQSKRTFFPGSWLGGCFFLVLAAVALAGCSDNGSKVPSGTAVVQAPAVEPADAVTAMDKDAAAHRGDPVAGKEVYDNFCHYCHGRQGMGDGPIGIAITPAPADLVHDKSRRSRSDEQLFYSITEGVRRKTGSKEMAMPRWKDVLSEKQRWDVLAYIRQLQKEYSAKTSGDSEKTGEAAAQQ